MNGRISVNFGQILSILKKHAEEISERTGVLSVNGIIVDAVIDRLRDFAALTDEEKIALSVWQPRRGATKRQGAL